MWCELFFFSAVDHLEWKEVRCNMQRYLNNRRNFHVLSYRVSELKIIAAKVEMASLIITESSAEISTPCSSSWFLPKKTANSLRCGSLWAQRHMSHQTMQSWLWWLWVRKSEWGEIWQNSAARLWTTTSALRTSSKMSANFARCLKWTFPPMAQKILIFRLHKFPDVYVCEVRWNVARTGNEEKR